MAGFINVLVTSGLKPEYFRTDIPFKIHMISENAMVPTQMP